jgi:hypothetical protein
VGLISESLYQEELMTTNVCRHPVTASDIQDVARAFEKVFAHADELRALAQATAAPAAHGRV